MPLDLETEIKTSRPKLHRIQSLLNRESFAAILCEQIGLHAVYLTWAYSIAHRHYPGLWWIRLRCCGNVLRVHNCLSTWIHAHKYMEYQMTIVFSQWVRTCSSVVPPGQATSVIRLASCSMVHTSTHHRHNIHLYSPFDRRSLHGYRLGVKVCKLYLHGSVKFQDLEVNVVTCILDVYLVTSFDSEDWKRLLGWAVWHAEDMRSVFGFYCQVYN